VNALIERIESSWNELTDLVAKLGPDALTRTAGDGWTVKDHLAHVGAWEHSLLGLIEGGDRLQAMGVHAPVNEDTDAINEAVRQLHSSESAEQVMEYFRDSHSKLMAALAKLSDADLLKPYAHYQPSAPDRQQPVSDWVAGNTWEHYAEHIGWINQLIKESSASR
jgi:uncharacterized protein (TIGR03083 family)